jgi:hypothetical protein
LTGGRDRIPFSGWTFHGPASGSEGVLGIKIILEDTRYPENSGSRLFLICPLLITHCPDGGER